MQNEMINEQGLFFDEVTLKNSKKAYAVGATERCTEETITIPSEWRGLPVESLTFCAFIRSPKVKKVNIPDSIKSVEGSKFYGSAIEEIIVSNKHPTLKTIDGNVYSKNGEILYRYAPGKKASTFTIPDSVLVVWEGAFFYCEVLMDIVIPDSVQAIAQNAFLGTGYYKKAKWENGALYMGNVLLGIHPHVRDVQIKEGTRIIACGNICPEYMCRQYALRSVTIPKSVVSISPYSFMECEELRKISIPRGVLSIGNNAFSWCKNLTELEFPVSLEEIAREAFQGCEALERIVYHGTAEQWERIEKGEHWNKYVPAKEITFETHIPLE